MIIEVLGLSSQSLLTLQVDYAISYFLLVYLAPLHCATTLYSLKQGRGKKGKKVNEEKMERGESTE